MKRGPAKNTRPEFLSHTANAVAAYGEPLPDWIAELASIADAEGLSGAEKRVSCSGSAISAVLNGKYRGDVGRVEQMVRGALMSLTVACPILGELRRDRCLDWQKKPFAPTSSHRMTMHRACKTCLNRRQPEKVNE